MAVILEMPKALGEMKARRMRRNERSGQSRKACEDRQAEEARRALLAKVHIARKQLGLTEGEYRAVLDTRCKVASSGELDTRSLQALVDYFKTIGWKPGRGPNTRKRQQAPHTVDHDETGQGREPYMGKIEALLADLGRLEGRFMPWAYASGILKRQTGLERLEYASRDQLQSVIAVLMKRVATLSKKRKTASAR
ncbi:hypothetical protein JCM15519_35710 [Fundidesulfovibrio butyratiphilus]